MLGVMLAGLGSIGQPARAQAEKAPAPSAVAQAAQEQQARPSPRVLVRGDDESFLSWMVRASGLIGVVILLMSFYLVALVVWLFTQYRRAVCVNEALVAELQDLLEHKQFDRAYELIEHDRSFLARALKAGVRKLSSGLPAAQHAMALANDDITMEMDHRTTYLATVGTLGPMIGLVGTVYGMIRSFQAIATMGSTPQANQLAAGISTALFLTLEGIALSVPAIAFYAMFRNRIARISLEVQMVSESLLERFLPGIRSPHPLITVAQQGLPRAALPPRSEAPE